VDILDLNLRKEAAMSISLGERLVNIEIRELRRKMEGVGGKNLRPHEKVAEINGVMKNIKRLHQQQRKDKFFSSEEYKSITRGLEYILTQTQNNPHNRR